MPLSFTRLSQVREKTKEQAELFRGKAQEVSQKLNETVGADRKGALFFIRSVAVMAGVCAIIYIALAIIQITRM